ncbi:MAG: YerC/YecD family TrpR-related protein [Oscillospiraceae bacterium]|nr:YerC/YecD family TrpR-related protein [Oscillospiraceae bacterium]
MLDKLKDGQTDRLVRALLSLESESECYGFLEDICTVTEIKAMAQRLEVASLLRLGMQYSAIAERTGASTATISRVNKCLLYGADGYKAVLDRVGD